MLQKISQFLLSFHSSKNPEDNVSVSQKWIKIRNVYWAANPHIRMISEGSRDAEDSSNDAENLVLPSQE